VLGRIGGFSICCGVIWAGTSFFVRGCLLSAKVVFISAECVHRSPFVCRLAVNASDRSGWGFCGDFDFNVHEICGGVELVSAAELCFGRKGQSFCWRV